MPRIEPSRALYQAAIDKRANNWEAQKALGSADAEKLQQLDNRYAAYTTLIELMDNDALPTASSPKDALFNAMRLDAAIDDIADAAASPADRAYVAQVKADAVAHIAKHPGADGRLLADQQKFSDRLAGQISDLEKASNTVGRFTNNSRVVPPDPGGRAGSYDDWPRSKDESRPLSKDESLVGLVRALGWDRDSRNMAESRDEDGRELSFRAVLKNGLDNGVIRNDMSGGAGGTGGYLIPTILTSEIIDLARAQTRVLQAGGRIVPMENRIVNVPKWTADPAASWRNEGAAVTTSDAQVSMVTLTAKTLAVITKVSLELLEDTSLEQELMQAFAKSFALAFDFAALYGPTGGPGPVGVKNVAGITKTSLGTNGASPTWDNLVDSVGRLRDVNENPSGQITADRTLRSLGKLKATTGEYLEPPTYLDDVPRFATNQVPINLTVGTANNTSDVFTADWSQLLLGVRVKEMVITLRERYMDTGEVGFVCWFRGDVQVARPAAFDIVTGVLP